MKVIMTGGGTGGHIYPAIAIADELKRRNEDVDILFVGAEIGMERDLVPESGYEIALISADGFGRSLRANLKAAKRVAKGYRQARDLVKEFAPDVVIGTGGYASAPVVTVAQRMGIPTYLHEQNAIPGKTNRFLARKAKRIFLGVSRADEHFNAPDKTVRSGNPVRSEFADADRTAAREALGIPEDRLMILAFGGSQGAGRINREMVRLIEKYASESGVGVHLGAGGYYFDAVCQELKDKGIEIGDRIQVTEYIHNMSDVLAASDVVISRSGALTVAEVTACGIPAVFVPFPDAAEDHQYYNALSVAGPGGAVIIREENLEEGRLYQEVERLRQDPALLEDMRKKARACGVSDAAARICAVIEEDLADE